MVTKVPKSRLKVTVTLLMICLFVLGGRLLFIQGIDAEDQAQQAMDRRTRPVTLAPERGSIVDRDGNVMAESVQRYDLVVDQRLVHDSQVWDPETASYVDLDIEEQLQELSNILDIDYPELRELMIGDRPYRVVSRRVTPEVRQEARSEERRVGKGGSSGWASEAWTSGL